MARAKTHVVRHGELGLRLLIVAGPPLTFVVHWLWASLTGHIFAVDFEHEFWPTGQHVLHGQSPFPPVTREAVDTGFAFAYPPLTALLMAPFALLPVGVAAGLFTAILAACAGLALCVAGVRDWRCYLTVFAWPCVLGALQTANLTLLLALGAALVWRYRDHPRAAGFAAGTTIALKIFLWPLGVWMLATRRYAGAAWAAASALLLVVGAWAVIGFAGLGDYVPLLRLLTRLEEREGYTPLGVSLKLGLGLQAARAVGAVAAVAVLGAVVVLARRPHGERASFAVALAACILWTPLTWLHYFALLIVALAVLRPRYDWVWLLPFFAWAPVRPSGPTWFSLYVLPIFALTLVLALRTPARAAPRLRLAPSSG